MLQPPPASVPPDIETAFNIAAIVVTVIGGAFFGLFRVLSFVKKRKTDEHQVVENTARQAANYAIARATEERARADVAERANEALKQDLRDCEDQRDAYAIRLKLHGIEVDPDTGDLPALE